MLIYILTEKYKYSVITYCDIILHNYYITRKHKSKLYKVQKTRTHELKENLASRASREETTADLLAPRGRLGPQLKGPPQFKLQDLNMQMLSC